jgi:hypothetical protein
VGGAVIPSCRTPMHSSCISISLVILYTYRKYTSRTVGGGGRGHEQWLYTARAQAPRPAESLGAGLPGSTACCGESSPPTPPAGRCHLPWRHFSGHHAAHRKIFSIEDVR